jgi:hypothetical protein
MYINGVAVKNYNTNGNSCGKMTTGSFEIGGSVENSSFVSYSTFFDIRVSNNAHTAAQVAQNVAAIASELAVRGVPLTPPQYLNPVQQLFFAGDSITCGTQAGGSPSCVGGLPANPGTTSSNSYTNQLTLDQTFTVNNFGVPNALVQQQVAAAPVLYAPLCTTQNGKSIASLFEGTNNFAATSVALQVWQYAVGWNNIMKAAGCKTMFIAMISRGGTGASGTTFETYKTQYNALARAGWKQAGFDAFVDLEADTFVGCNGCNANGTFFAGDLTHPLAAGQAKIALAVGPAVNYLSHGSTPDNPNPTVITAAAYTSLPVDGGLIFNTASNSITDTLFSARWESGRIISRCNNTLSGANTLTITAPADFPFNNVAGTTTVTVANNTCRLFQSTFVAGSPNGDYWRVIQ